MKINWLPIFLLMFSIFVLPLTPLNIVVRTTDAEIATSVDESVNQSDPSLSIDFNKIEREIKLGEMGRIHLSDSYYITNKAVNDLSKIEIFLPKGSFAVSAHDAMGDLFVLSEEQNETTYTNMTLILRVALKESETGRFTVTYQLPWDNHINQDSWVNFDFTFTLFERLNWNIRNLTVSVILPEGAKFVSSTAPSDIEVLEGTFQEKVLFSMVNVTRFDDRHFTVAYQHIIFWASFRPTLWVGVLTATVCVIAFFRRVPKPPVPTIHLPPELIRSFVDTYREKMRVLLELKSVEDQTRKRKISRRRYRIQRKSLEARISVLSRDLKNLQERIQSASPRYADMIRRIEVAETELDGVGESIRRVESRYRNREISSEAYRKLIEEYRRREESTETEIDSLLLQLQEEPR